MSTKRQALQKLSLEFMKDIYRDGIKVCLLPAKILLQSVYCWPDNNALYANIMGWLLFWNLVVIEIFHTSYVLKNFNNIGDAVSTFATVTTTMEGLIRLYIMITKKHVINKVLVNVWKQLWPLDTIEPKRREQIRRRAQASVLLTSFFLVCSITSNSQITGSPYVRYHDMLLKSVFPFNWNRPYIYEVLYVWQYFSDWFVLFMINAFDFFFVSLVTVCFLQFVIMQEVIKSILTEESRTHRRIIFDTKGDNMSDREMLSECLNHHKLIIGMCNEMESSFNIAILLQFFTSTTGICAATLILKVDSSQFLKMFTFAVGHTAQLFYYCYVGQQLSYESGSLAQAIYDCDWHLHYDRNFRKALIMMIQRSQKIQCLTGAGITELDFTSFIAIMRLSFSFYTLLNNLLMKNEGQ